MSDNTQELYRQVLQTDFCEYCKFVNKPTWKATKFHQYLTHYVQEFVQRETENPYDILCIHCPPQYGKSLSITETFPSWYLGNYPNNRVIEISYGEDFAKKFGRLNREKIREFGSMIFGINIKKDIDTVLEFEVDNGKGSRGGMLSRGAGTGITGQAANLIIIDDPIKNNTAAESTIERNKLYDEWLTSFRSRLGVGAKVILIMTRWHEDDLTGRLLEEEPNIEYLRLPCEADSEDDPLGREIGEPLCPEIGKDKEWTENFKSMLNSTKGARTWNSLYQGRPTSAEGNMLERDWWVMYETLPEMVVTVMSVDATFKGQKENDFVAIQIWGKTGANYYLIDAVKKHLNFPSTIREIRRLKGMYPDCQQILIEEKANGAAIIQMLRHEMSGITPVVPRESKVARVDAISGAIESGNVFLPKNKKFTNEFVEECASFPQGKSDDQVDAMSQALYKLIYRRGNASEKERPKSNMEKLFPEYYKKKNKGEEKINVI